MGKIRSNLRLACLLACPQPARLVPISVCVSAVVLPSVSQRRGTGAQVFLTHTYYGVLVSLSLCACACVRVSARPLK